MVLRPAWPRAWHRHERHAGQAISFLFGRFGFEAAEYDWSELLADAWNYDVRDYLEKGQTTFRMTRTASALP